MMIPMNEITLRSISCHKKGPDNADEAQRHRKHDQKRMEERTKLGRKNHIDQNDSKGQGKEEHSKGLFTIGRRIMLLNARQIQRGLGKERIILLAIEDITERRKIENGLEKAHEELKDLAIELERVAQAKSKFLANMSH